MPSTTVEAPTMSAQEQEILDEQYEALLNQQEVAQQEYLMGMEDRGKVWRWKDEYLDEEGNLKDVEYSADPEIQKKIDDYNAKIKDTNDKIADTQKHSSADRYWANERRKLEKQNEEYQAEVARLNAKIEKGKEDWEGPQEGDSDYGSWEDMTEEELQASMTEAEWENYQLGREQTAHSRSALAGELPLSESLLTQKQKEFEQLKETFGITGDSLENATGQDTIGIQNLDTFKKRWAQLEDAQRYGQSSSSMEAAVLGKGLTTDLSANTTGSNYANNFANTMSGYNSLLAPLQMYRQAGYQAQAANAANQSSMWGSLLGVGGMLGAAALMSSKKFKKNIHPKSKKDEDKALKDVRKTKSYDYRYKPMMGMGDLKHIGTIAEKSPRSFSNGEMINLGDKMEVLAMAVKALDRKVARK